MPHIISYPPIKKVERVYQKIALFGGVYNNHLALQKACELATSHGCEGLFQLGDLGGFGPCPDKVFPILERFQVQCIQGNYEESLVTGLDDCGCGYTHPKDNYYAQISYDYTNKNLSADNRKRMENFPKQMQIKLGPLTVHLCHGSPRRINEFLWETTTSIGFAASMMTDLKCDVLCCTHTGLPWKREIAPGKGIVNVGVLGRPANNGTPAVCYAELSNAGGKPHVDFVSVEYDWQTLAAEMKSEKLPDEFIQTITDGYWTTCLEILPGKERARGRY